MRDFKGLEPALINIRIVMIGCRVVVARNNAGFNSPQLLVFNSSAAGDCVNQKNWWWKFKCYALGHECSDNLALARLSGVLDKEVKAIGVLCRYENAICFHAVGNGFSYGLCG